MRLVYTSDLHGNLVKYQQVLDLAVTHEAHAVIFGGDLLTPTISVTTAIAGQRAFITQLLAPLLCDFHTNYPAIALYLLPGSDDWAGAVMAFAELERAGVVHMLHEQVYPLNERLWLAGYACVPITPFSIKDYERSDGEAAAAHSFAVAYTSEAGEPVRTSLAQVMQRPAIAEELEALAWHSDPADTIYVCHAPPYGTALDMQRQDHHAGSHAVRTFIEQHQPLLTLHGHIHESPRMSKQYIDNLGPTWMVNAGNEPTDLDAVVFDTDAIAETISHTRYGPFARTVNG